ncbi:hypothetical protein RKD35_000650 [Streptomyces albogriseolus]
MGVEEELLLVDPETGEPRAMSAAVLARAEREDAGQDVFEKELHEQMVEFATHPQSSMERLHAEISRCRKEGRGSRRGDRLHGRRAGHVAAAGQPGGRRQRAVPVDGAAVRHRHP